jgi:hypothetical protein
LSYLESSQLTFSTIILYSCSDTINVIIFTVRYVVSQKVLWTATAVPLRLKVSFKTVELRSHALILGDNPAVSIGLPISIDWEAVESVILDLDEYETSRPPRRERRQLIVPKTTREDRLLEQGVALGEMAKVEDEIKVIKKHRRRNARKRLWERIQEVFRSIDRSARDDNASAKAFEDRPSAC